MRAATMLLGVALLLGMTSAVTATATEAPAATSHGAGKTPPPIWVALTPAELREVLPPPPQPSSLADVADLDVVLLLQTMRSPQDEAEGEADARRDAVQWASWALGEHFDPACQTHAVRLLQTLHNDLRTANRAANAAWGERPRPAKTDPRVKPSLPNAVDGPGYPSARTAATRVFAEALAGLYPEQRERLLAAAERSAMLRVIGGSHYPTDIAGGSYTATLFLQRLAAVPGYRDALREASEELARCATSRGDAR